MHVTIELGKVTDWLTAAGTIGAVWSALYLANRDNSVRLQAFATVGLKVGGSNASVATVMRYVWINVTNAGRRTAYVTNIGWRSGVLRQGFPLIGYVHSVQSFEPGDGPQLSAKLEDGQSITWFLPLDEWMEANAESMMRPAAWLHMRTTYLQVFTSTEPPLTVKIGRSLREKMVAFVKERRASGPQPP
jgi:hypothetical protein